MANEVCSPANVQNSSDNNNTILKKASTANFAKAIESSTDSNLFYLFIKFFVFRLANALVVHTYFNPDEFWQGPEVRWGLAIQHY